MSVNWAIIGSCNGLSPVRCQAITWTNDDLLSIRPPGTIVLAIWIEILTFSFKNTKLKISSAKWRPFCPREGEFKKGIFKTSAILEKWVKLPQPPTCHNFVSVVTAADLTGGDASTSDSIMITTTTLSKKYFAKDCRQPVVFRYILKIRGFKYFEG